jgi:hypothetical protein
MALGAFTAGDGHRIGLLIARDEPPPIPGTIAVYPGAALAVAQDVAEVVKRALPAIAARGKKARDVEAALRKHFAAREVDDHAFWQMYFGGPAK